MSKPNNKKTEQEAQFYATDEVKTNEAEIDAPQKMDNMVIGRGAIIYSISDANDKMREWNPETAESEQLPRDIVASLIEDENNKKSIAGLADEYHNLCSEYARKRLPALALKVAILGTKRYPQNVDLLADVIRFGGESVKWDACKKAYERLQGIPKQMWNWRAFTFTIDYLKARYSTEQEAEKETTYKAALELAEAYKQSNLCDERAWVADAELKLIKNQIAEAIDTLEDGIKTVAVAPQCCLKLADLYLEQGKYEKVIHYAAIGATVTAQEQPSTSIGYLYYISGLAKDALIHKEALEKPDDAQAGFRNLARVQGALSDYDIAETLFRAEKRVAYLGTIWMRETILKKKSGIEEQTNGEDSKIEKALLERLLMQKQGNH